MIYHEAPRTRGFGLRNCSECLCREMSTETDRVNMWAQCRGHAGGLQTLHRDRHAVQTQIYRAVPYSPADRTDSQHAPAHLQTAAVRLTAKQQRRQISKTKTSASRKYPVSALSTIPPPWGETISSWQAVEPGRGIWPSWSHMKSHDMIGRH